MSERLETSELQTRERETSQRQTPDSLMLYGFWYRALPSGQVSRNRLHKAMLLETPLVLGRDRQGKPFALRDACPHRVCRSPAAGLTGRIWSAAIMAGSSMRIPGNAN